MRSTNILLEAQRRPSAFLGVAHLAVQAGQLNVVSVSLNGAVLAAGFACSRRRPPFLAIATGPLAAASLREQLPGALLVGTREDFAFWVGDRYTHPVEREDNGVLELLLASLADRIDSHHVVLCGVDEPRPSQKLPRSWSLVGDCADLRRDWLVASLPGLLWVDCRCVEVTCQLVDSLSERIAVICRRHELRLQIEDVSPIVFRNMARREAGGVAAITLEGLKNNLTLEEAVSLASSDAGLVSRTARDQHPETRIRRTVDAATHVGTISRDAVALLIFREDRLLLGRKSDDRAFIPGRWYLPGGKREGHETFLAAASRELREETGLDALSLALCGFSSYTDASGQTLRFAQFTGTAEGIPVAADDLVETRWIDIAEIERGAVFPLTWAQLVILDAFGVVRLGVT